MLINNTLIYSASEISHVIISFVCALIYVGLHNNGFNN